MRMSWDCSKTLPDQSDPISRGMFGTCTSRNRKHSEKESNDFFIDLIATFNIPVNTRKTRVSVPYFLFHELWQGQHSRSFHLQHP